MRVIHLATLVALTVTCAVTMSVTAQNKTKVVRRAEPPKFDSKDADGVFFEDVFREGLVGSRPDLGAAVVNVGPRVNGSGTGSSTPPMAGGGLHAWKDVISAEAIEDEIKKIKLDVDETVTTPNQFASSGYKKARRQFSMLAAMFAIIAEYDGDVRWKENAAELRDVFARTAANSAVGTIQVYNEAKLRKQELGDLVAGSALDFAKKSDPKGDWEHIVDRSPVMMRLEIAHQGRMQGWVSSEAEFKANQDALRQEANIVAALGEILIQDGMVDAEEDEYKAFGVNMRDAAREIIDGIKLNSYDQARTAVGAIGQACSNCHDGFR